MGSPPGYVSPARSSVCDASHRVERLLTRRSPRDPRAARPGERLRRGAASAVADALRRSISATAYAAVIPAAASSRRPTRTSPARTIVGTACVDARDATSVVPPCHAAFIQSNRPSPVTTTSASAIRASSPTASATKADPGTSRPPTSASPKLEATCGTGAGAPSSGASSRTAAGAGHQVRSDGVAERRGREVGEVGLSARSSACACCGRRTLLRCEARMAPCSPRATGRAQRPSRRIRSTPRSRSRRSRRTHEVASARRDAWPGRRRRGRGPVRQASDAERVGEPDQAPPAPASFGRRASSPDHHAGRPGGQGRGEAGRRLPRVVVRPGSRWSAGTERQPDRLGGLEVGGRPRTSRNTTGTGSPSRPAR